MRNEMPEGKDSAKKLKNGSSGRSRPQRARPGVDGLDSPASHLDKSEGWNLCSGLQRTGNIQTSLQFHLADEMLGLGLFKTER